MTQPCLEVLVATITLWVAIFGVVDEVVAHIPSVAGRISVYVALGLGCVVFVTTVQDVTWCSLQ